jgi:hypothetical protein
MLELNPGDTTALIIFSTPRTMQYSITGSIYYRGSPIPIPSRNFLIFDKSSHGFRVSFNQPIDSTTYVFDWMVEDVENIYYAPYLGPNPPGAVEPGETIFLSIEGGVAPFDCYQESGTGSGFTIGSYAHGCTVTADPGGASGSIVVGVKDGTGRYVGSWGVGGGDCSSCISIEWDDGVSASTIGQDDSVTVAVTGGEGKCGYYDWTVEGSGFSFQNSRTYSNTNTLISSPSACGMANISVTTYCGADTTGTVKCTAGSWYRCCSNVVPTGSCGVLCSRSPSWLDNDAGSYRAYATNGWRCNGNCTAVCDCNGVTIDANTIASEWWNRTFGGCGGTASCGPTTSGVVHFEYWGCP